MRPLAAPVFAGLGIVISGLSATRSASGGQTGPCSENREDWVHISVAAPANATLAAKLTEHLRADLEPYQMVVCDSAGPGSKPPLARVRIVVPNANTVGIEVWVEDAVTDKKLIRQLDLRSLPPDAHAMAIALGAAELLRASWAEIRLRGAPPRVRPVPESVQRSLADDAKHKTYRASLGVQLAGEEFTRGLRQGGVDARVVLCLAEPWCATMRIGARRAIPVQAPDGKVGADAWLAGVGTLIRLTPQDSHATLGIVGRMDLLQLHIVAEPREGASARSRSATAAIIGTGVAGAIQANSSAWIEVEVDAGGVLKGVRANDNGHEVMAMNGTWVGASLGLGVLFW